MDTTEPIVELFTQSELATLQDEEIQNFVEDYEWLMTRSISQTDKVVLRCEIEKLQAELSRRAENQRIESELVALNFDVAASARADWFAYQMECHGYQMDCGGAL